jgi:hypothetical protein
MKSMWLSFSGSEDAVLKAAIIIFEELRGTS